MISWKILLILWAFEMVLMLVNFGFMFPNDFDVVVTSIIQRWELDMSVGHSLSLHCPHHTENAYDSRS